MPLAFTRKAKRLRLPEDPILDSKPTLTEQVVAFVDRYMPPGGKGKEK